MANFRTHAVVGVIASGMMSTLVLAAGAVPPSEMVAVAMAGVIGAILPDVDLQNSRASQAMFAILALFLSFALLFQFSPKLSIAEMWIVWIGTFVSVRFGLHNVFHKYAVHRGIFHSVLAGVFFACVASAMCFHLFDTNATVAWLAGSFMFVGYLIHLLLDEMYSVDFHGDRIKRSFGSALKLIEWRSMSASFFMAVAVALAALAAPSIDSFWQTITDHQVWASLNQRLLPEGSWFGFLAGADIANAATGVGAPAVAP